MRAVAPVARDVAQDSREPRAARARLRSRIERAVSATLDVARRAPEFAATLARLLPRLGVEKYQLAAIVTRVQFAPIPLESRIAHARLGIARAEFVVHVAIPGARTLRRRRLILIGDGSPTRLISDTVTVDLATATAPSASVTSNTNRRAPPVKTNSEDPNLRRVSLASRPR